jgi:hypothetical protein
MVSQNGVLKTGSSFAPSLRLFEEEKILTIVEGRVNWLLALFGVREWMWITTYRVVHCATGLLSANLSSLNIDQIELVATRGEFRLWRLIFGILLFISGLGMLLTRSFSPFFNPPTREVGFVLLIISVYLLVTCRINRFVVAGKNPYSLIGIRPRNNPEEALNILAEANHAFHRKETSDLPVG